jgi:hypothetical protein
MMASAVAASRMMVLMAMSVVLALLLLMMGFGSSYPKLYFHLRHV